MLYKVDSRAMDKNIILSDTVGMLGCRDLHKYCITSRRFEITDLTSNWTFIASISGELSQPLKPRYNLFRSEIERGGQYNYYHIIFNRGTKNPFYLAQRNYTSSL